MVCQGVPGFVIRGIPRTLKNHGTIIQIPKPGARTCHSCGHKPGFPKIIPSPQYQEWEREAVKQLMAIKLKLGIPLPITDKVSIEALVYRDRDVGDVCGFLQAIGDMLQEAGVLKDDKLIDDWDGSRRLKDAANPRVEVFITILETTPVQENLLG